MTTLVKPGNKLTFQDRLSHLNFEQAAKLLGPKGKKLIIQGSAREVRLREEVYLGGDLLRVSFPSPAGGMEAIATLTLSSDAPQRLRWNCDRCETACEHVGACFRFCWRTSRGFAWPLRLPSGKSQTSRARRPSSNGPWPTAASGLAPNA